ncbi:MAG: NADH-quinone oxidoreductase subunit L [Armatimonadota bacterium]|nr:NADH-quinone oxidoreductase subunit L [Armatimonadota bacterium]
MITNINDTILGLTWLIPILPLVGFGLILLTGKRGPGQGAYIAITAIVLSFILAVLVSGIILAHYFTGGHEFEPFARSIEWLTIAGIRIHMGFVVDQLTVMMLLVVTIVAMLVQIYSVGYMHGDPRYPRFFAYLSLFSAAMLGLVTADNLILLFVSWELVGLTSYLLIGFWFEKPEAMRAAKKAFIVTRVGDLGFLLGVLLLFQYTGTVKLSEIFSQVPALASATYVIGRIVIPFLPLVGILLFMGAIGKSAQFPLHVWLPDAMEGPTPVSALIHAATMVAAGVYLVGRMYPIFHYQEESLSLAVVAIIGAITALMAATIATVINDMKRVLAYSTISQLGYMMLGLGVGGYTAGLLHLMTHAFFKANLFLGAGSVIHATGVQDIQEMGGLKKKMPVTFWTFVISSAALAGLPLTAGFFSKDEILLEVFHASKPLFVVGVLAAFLTAFYMTRLVALAFLGKPRRQDIHAHESPRVMIIPLIVLGILSIVAGYVALPWKNVFHDFIHFGNIETTFSWLVAAITTFMALGGIGLGAAMYVKPVISPEAVRKKLYPIYVLLKNKYYFDEIYWALVVVPFLKISKLFGVFDQKIIDGIVNGIAWLTVWLSILYGWFDKWVVDGLVNVIGLIPKVTGRTLRFIQTGVLQNYLLFAFFAVLIMAWLYLHRAWILVYR